MSSIVGIIGAEGGWDVIQILMQSSSNLVRELKAG
jgi:hypothetical protein